MIPRGGFLLAALFTFGLAAASPVPAVTIDGIAATVNGKIITILELEKAGKPVLERRLPTVQKRERDKLKREILAEILDQLILRTLQKQRAAAIGLRQGYERLGSWLVHQCRYFLWHLPENSCLLQWLPQRGRG